MDSASSAKNFQMHLLAVSVQKNIAESRYSKGHVVIDYLPIAAVQHSSFREVSDEFFFSVFQHGIY